LLSNLCLLFNKIEFGFLILGFTFSGLASFIYSFKILFIDPWVNKCIQNKKFKATTNSNHDLPIAPNLLDQDFSCKEPGKVYGTDITYISTDEGWLYLAGVRLHSRAISRRFMTRLKILVQRK
jgi:hypothetical protein